MIINPHAAFGEVIWAPGQETIDASALKRFIPFLRGHGIIIGDTYDEVWQWSVDEPEQFWSLFAEFSGVQLGGPVTQVCTTDQMPHTQWFPGRSINFARHLLDGREGMALLAVSEDGQQKEITWETLRDEVAALAHHLRTIGVTAGDRVVAILPNVAEAVVGFLATSSIGAVWSICAPEFGPRAVISRFAQLEPKVVIAAPGYMLSGKDRDCQAALAEILAGLSTLEQVIWVDEHTTVMPPASSVPAVDWQQAIATSADLIYTDVDFNHPLWVLFSSGTTGKPKGIVHGHGGALLELLKMLTFHTELQPGDRYLNVASTSWVLWNALVGALGVGATAVLVDGNPTYPSVDRVWEIAADTETSALGVSAGFIHACAKADLRPGGVHNLSRLQCLQVTGSPLSVDGFRWVYSHVGDVWLASMSGGTDIVSVFVGGTSTLPVHAGFIQVSALGVRVESWDEQGVPTSAKGELVVTQPIPSMPLYFWGDDDNSRYYDSYFSTYPGVWRHGDIIEFTDSGILIHGRSDSTLNRNGLRLGSADIYTVVEALPEVAEAMVVGAEIGSENYYMPLFIRMAPDVEYEDAREAIITAIRLHLSPRYLPDDIVAMRAIPHTKTGKKLEVPVKRLIQGDSLGQVVDLGAVDDPALIKEYASFAQQWKTALNTV
ncbi:Acetyl-coenzyme A synthetase (plasmid) [Corynebacterium occultum]|uniref:Acetyl-coenzyme A synthetase n=1 Tax=Corynebacterium occultum TaxID=2675219 RepID=A0A6B8VTE1_9CORY|nr:acetoacetate--CoA ligase [Corynebacterium occultum]QGU08782.1 Acetyl-coenzyme A synthetase [Corynebacterium occultum]